MNDFFVFRTVSGAYDVQLDEPRPQFGLERQKKIGSRHLIVLFYLPRAFSTPCIQVGKAGAARWDGAFSRRCSPCHAPAFTRVRTRMRS